MREFDLTLRRELEELSTHQLREKIDKEIQKDVPDDELVLLVLDILKGRDASRPPELTEGQKKLWEAHERKLQNRGKTPLQYVPRGVRWAAMLVAVLGALLLALPQTVTAGSVWKIVASWTADIFRYENIGGETEATEEAGFQTDNPGLQQVYDALGELGIEPRPVPMWLPEGYELEWIKVIDTPAEVGIHAYFTNGEKDAILDYRRMQKDLSPDYDKNETNVSGYECNGTIHNMIQNIDTWTVNWTIQNLKCSIYIDCQEDVVKQIIRSIY